VKNLKLTIITVCLGIIFLLINGATDIYAYHDLGNHHVDNSMVACIHANHHKAKNPPLLPEPIFYFDIPEVPPYMNANSREEAYPPAFAYFSQLPSRASPLQAKT
jgi:hypothetical protein